MAILALKRSFKSSLMLLASLLLGFIQGLTEFFPVSSSLHLHLVEHLLQDLSLEQKTLLNLSCHFGTLCAVTFFLRKDIHELFRDFKFSFWFYFMALAPLVPAYYLVKKLPANSLDNPKLWALCLFITSLLLLLSEIFPVKDRTRKKDGFFIGLAQACALLPGLSRSAATIFAAKAVGLNREKAVKVSFLLSIPTIAGGTLLESFKISQSNLLVLDTTFTFCLLGFLASLVTGSLMVKVAFSVLSKTRFYPFAIYTAILGALCLLYI